MAARLKEMKQEDEAIMPNTAKRVLEIEDDQTVLTNDDIWDDELDIEDDMVQDMLDYYEY